MGKLSRRTFLTRAAAGAAGAALAAPYIVPSSALGKDGAVAPSERIVLGAIGVGGRGTYVLRTFLHEPEVQCVAVTEVQTKRRDAAKAMVDVRNGNTDCATYRDLREMLARKDIDACMIATGPNWHGAASALTARAGKDMYCEKPCSKNINESFALADLIRRTGRIFQAGTQRRSLPNFMFAIHMARTGKLGKLNAVHAHGGGFTPGQSGWMAPEKPPEKGDVDWDMFLGPAAFRPYNRKLLDGFNFEKGGGLVGGGCLEWGSHCVDLCQWANNSDDTAPVEYEPVGKELHAKYPNGTKLVIRNDGWMNTGSCPVRFEGEAGWAETGDSGDLFAEPANLLAGWRTSVKGYPADFHVRNFLDCVKTRGQTRANADVAAWAHVTCHAANIALYLKRKVTYDPKKNEFPGDEEANRLRGEALREPWRI